MRLPIRNQILWPLMGLLLIAVAANAAFSAWWMSVRARQSLEARQQQIIGVLEESSFPLSSTVMTKLRRLTGGELIVWDSALKRVVVGTLPAEDVSETDFIWNPDLTPSVEPQKLVIRGIPYLVRAGRLRGSPSQTMFVLTPEEALSKASREAIWAPLAIGALTIVLSIPLVLNLASGWARRIRLLQRHVETIAQGQFGLELPVGPIDDELTRLVDSINSTSRQLLAMREKLIQGERTRLVAQLTAGFAHQLRNGLAGAKLAIQLHESRCSSKADSSLSVACNQLALVEEEVQGLLSLGKEARRYPTQVDLGQIVHGVQKLVSLSCEHQGVELKIDSGDGDVSVLGYADGLRAAILNLTLNAIDAVGPGGHVWLTLRSEGSQKLLVVEDDGPGPPTEVAESLFESFVTSKPEGIGLGLTVAATVAQSHQGSLSWRRLNNRTRFELVLPETFALNESRA